jgi:UDP-N-acetylmuramoyl-L-alanyl-D-glutamate--2,6-diaminopimelate ligase
LFGLQLNIGGEEVWFNLTGTFNAYNILAVYAVAINLGLPSKEILVALSKTEGATGRFEAFRFEGGITVIIDYAHTPDALVNVLKTLRSLTQGNIIAIVGCGGDRDREKRPVMARIAVEYASIVIFTSDNPRNEEPSAILMEMEIGVPAQQRKKYLVVENRKEAIAVGARLVHEGDVLLVAGKGHEEYQEIKGIRYPFSDREEVFKNFEKQRN